MRKANLEENMANNKHRAIHSLKSWLFTPATKTGRFGRAAQVGADILIIDLEDAVAFSDKEKARTGALQYLEQPAERGALPTAGIFTQGSAQILGVSTCGCKKQACSTQESPCIECPAAECWQVHSG